MKSQKKYKKHDLSLLRANPFHPFVTLSFGVASRTSLSNAVSNNQQTANGKYFITGFDQKTIKSNTSITYNSSNDCRKVKVFQRNKCG